MQKPSKQVEGKTKPYDRSIQTADGSDLDQPEGRRVAKGNYQEGHEQIISAWVATNQIPAPCCIVE